MGVDVSKFNGPLIPVIYLIDFRDPAGYFMATKFAMRNKDVIYVSNAFAVESTKAMTYFENDRWDHQRSGRHGDHRRHIAKSR